MCTEQSKAKCPLSTTFRVSFMRFVQSNVVVVFFSKSESDKTKADQMMFSCILIHGSWLNFRWTCVTVFVIVLSFPEEKQVLVISQIAMALHCGTLITSGSLSSVTETRTITGVFVPSSLQLFWSVVLQYDLRTRVDNKHICQHPNFFPDPFSRVPCQFRTIQNSRCSRTKIGSQSQRKNSTVKQHRSTSPLRCVPSLCLVRVPVSSFCSRLQHSSKNHFVCTLRWSGFSLMPTF